MDNAGTVLATFLLLATRSVANECHFKTELESSEECIGLYECSETLGDVAEIVRDWDCAKPQRQQNCNQGFCQITFAAVEKYFLKIRIVNASDNIYDIFINIREVSDHIVTLNLNNGNTTFIPSEVYNLPKLTLLDVSRNKINNINLLTALKIEQLIIFNASFNLISEMERTSFENNRIGSNISTIDLSHNVIKIIPDNYFSKFSNLLHLNLSNNEIKSFSVLTFEGLSQLETLYLSNNNLQQIDMTLARFSNLKELILDHNDLSTIEENNFRMLTCLVTLNLSFNKITFIEDISFQKMTNLKYIQLSDNNITVISKSMFMNNAALQQVDISNNQIHTIAPFSFRGTNIVLCNFRNNALTNLDDKSILYGIKAKQLDLSVSSIVSLSEHVFFELHSQLQLLNLSYNSIAHIHKNTFRDLELLTELDLSNNKLIYLDFDMSDLKRLSVFNVANNLIRKVSKSSFRDLKSLMKVNLSKNSIAEIEIYSFQDLAALKFIDLSNNILPNVVVPNTFRGLSQTYELRLMHSKLTSLQDAAFFTMTALTYFNASYGNIDNLGYNIFNGTNIWTLDLSHNRLEIFNVNNSFLKHLMEIHLNDNQIQQITTKTFYGLNNLKKIILDNNNILRISGDAFCSLYNISLLHLSSNPNIKLDASMFSNMALRELKLQNIWKSFNFSNAVSTSMEILDLSFSNITDVNSVMIYKIKNLEMLLLHSNNIYFIDKYSFQTLSSLVFLDLSNNIISIIKPGSFADTHGITILNLYSNNLVSLTYGVFDGLPNLEVLNLSSNALHLFDGRLFHNTHKLSIVSVDDNLIDHIDFYELKAANILKVTIGGNMIPCNFLVSAKKHNFYGISVTSHKFNFQVENVDGVSCKGSQIESSTDYNQMVNRNTKTVPIIDQEVKLGPARQYFHVLSTQLDALKTAIYFEASCLLVIVCLLLGVVSFVYFKLRSKMLRKYNLSSRRRLTDSIVEMELSANN